MSDTTSASREPSSCAAFAPTTPHTFLDRAVVRAHGVRWLGQRYHPYFACFDLAMLLGMGVGGAFSALVPGMSVWGWLVVFVVEVLAYQAYLVVKRRALGIASRSFLQDTLFFLLPSYALASLAVGHELRAAFDALGIMFPIVLGTIRIGCFLGGCCYGRSAHWGVSYPSEIFRTVTTWRTFTPGAPTAERVIPVQLIEAAVNYALFIALCVRLWLGAEPRGHTLALYLLGYAFFRLVAESLRGTRHRPKWGPLSQAQWISLALIPVCMFLLIWL